MVLALLACTIGVTKAQNPSFIADLNNKAWNFNPTESVVFNNKLYFAGGTITKRLYEYDGTNEPTQISACSNPNGFCIWDNKLYFSGNLYPNGQELMVYDGTNAPSTVADIVTTSQNGSNPAYLTVYNNKLYFQANNGNGANGAELWSYDGTSASMVQDLWTGSSSSAPRDMKVHNNVLYFAANTSSGYPELHAYNGNTTKQYVINNGGPSYVQNLVVFNDTLFFSANDGGTAGQELFKLANDTPRLALDIRWGSSSPVGFTIFNNKLYFQSQFASNGNELVEWDGINAATLVGDIWPGNSGSQPRNLTVFDNKLYFSAYTADLGFELYVYNGVDAPSLIEDIYQGTTSSSPSFFTEYNNKLYFAAMDSVYGNELRFIPKGKFEGISLFKDMLEGTENSNPRGFTEYKGKVYFSAIHAKYANELWSIDNNNVPNLTGDFQIGNGSFDPNNFVVFKDKLLFSATLPFGNNYEIHSYDGVNKPFPIARLRTGGFGSRPNNFIEFKNNLYFGAEGQSTGGELWKYNGTDTPTMVVDLAPGTNWGFYSVPMIEFKDKIIFTGNNGTNGNEPWMYDGTNTPTMVADLRPGADQSTPKSYTVFNGKLYFAANSGSSNTDNSNLWEWDGTNTPTKITTLWGVLDIKVFNNKLIIVAWEGSNQPELYEYNGVDAPSMIKDINPGVNASSPQYLTLYHGKLYFTAYDGSTGQSLYSYDGTDVVKFPNISTNDYVGYLGTGLGNLYFTAENPNGLGTELYMLRTPAPTNSNMTNTKQNINIYPNPTADFINLSQSVQKIEIFDINGSLLYEDKKPNTSISLSLWPKGIYIVTLQTSTGRSTHKIIKN